MKILVLAENYTNLEGIVSLQYIHTRNLEYVARGYQVDVLSFRAKTNYVLDGIKIFSENEFDPSSLNQYDIVLSHAPNLKNHLRFLKKHKKHISKILFFFHGHEVFDTTKIYPRDYSYLKNKNNLRLVRKIYDKLKLFKWRSITINEKNIYYIFVSQWMKDMFLQETKVDESLLPEHRIIPNSIGKIFETEIFPLNSKKIYDVISIRNNFDGSKYCVDLVVNQAINNPDLKFCLIGLGNYFNYNSIPKNLDVIYKNLNHSEIVQYLSSAKICYLPTRLDAQGVMACEIASFGMPIVTSNLKICLEMLSDFPNVEFLSNEEIGDFEEIINKIYREKPFEKIDRFYTDNTISNEIKFIEEIVGNDYV